MIEEKANILVIADKGIRKSLALIFKTKGYEVETAISGSEALLKLRENFFNMAILDIKLSDLKREDLINPAKETYPDIAVIMVTDHVSVETTVRSLNKGASASVIKPLNMREVLAIVKKCLKEQRFVEDERRAEEEFGKLNGSLECSMVERDSTFQGIKRDLEMFSCAFSHDLRGPLRVIDGFSRLMLEDYSDRLDAEGRRRLNIINSNTQKMGKLIEDIIAFFAMERKNLALITIDMTELAKTVFEELKIYAPERDLQVNIKTLAPSCGDHSMIREVFVNLISNAIKFTSPREIAVIEIGSDTTEENQNLYYVKDNGTGFDMQYVNKLFNIFMRLHTYDEFEGTGIGLSLVKAIIDKHGGQVWAEGKVNEGATFYFTLPIKGGTNNEGERI